MDCIKYRALKDLTITIPYNNGVKVVEEIKNIVKDSIWWIDDSINISGLPIHLEDIHMNNWVEFSKDDFKRNFVPVYDQNEYDFLTMFDEDLAKFLMLSDRDRKENSDADRIYWLCVEEINRRIKKEENICWMNSEE